MSLGIKRFFQFFQTMLSKLCKFISYLDIYCHSACYFDPPERGIQNPVQNLLPFNRIVEEDNSQLN